MNAPRHGEEFKDDFRKALPAELIQRLSRLSAGRSAWSLLQEIVVICALIAAALAWWTPWVVVLCVILIGTRQHALFVLAHDTQTNVAIRPLDDTSSKLRDEARHDRNAVILFHAGFLMIFAWSGFLLQYLVLWILPLVSVVQAILRLRAIAEHGATVDFSSPLTAARTNLVPAWLGWLLFPHHVNYHIEHHLYASVPQYNLPELHRELAGRGLLAGAEVMPFGATLGKIFSDRLRSAA